ncbi:MAG TPA: isoleucine--tRNA ligase [Acidobacteriota bacterium]|nr:isoleucine--tRNA ligase [Acidobacteriota bacterium]
MVEKSAFNPIEYEPQIQWLWEEKDVRAQLSKKNEDGKKFFFLQGPPYTSGQIHLGQAWNSSLKDIILRYKRLTGHKMFDRAGYDMHGLPTEAKVMKKLNLKNKEEIEAFGTDKFAQECLDFCKTHAELMNKDFQRLGVSMDFSNPYMPISREYISGIWWLIKKLHEEGRLYEGARTVYWDWMHETALAKHELEYKTVKDTSIFVKFPIRGEENTSLIIWTTTPWTIPFNLAVMVNPDVDYQYCEVEFEGTKQIWVVAAPLANVFIRHATDNDFTILKTVKGADLEGVSYIHPFSDEMKDHYEKIHLTSPKLHTVLMSNEYVDTTAGTGLVHCAPGCGPEDFEVGWRNGLPPFNLLSEQGTFQDAGPFTGRCAIPDNKLFIKDLQEKGAVVFTSTVEHEYPHAQRSGAPVCFRATKQWFWKVEDLKERMIEENNAVQWVPKSAYNSFNNWLNNLRDNSISKQRFWGAPLPVWRNEDDATDILVVGSVDELEQLTGQTKIEPHKPWIDDVVIEKDGKIYRRVIDVLDVWIDAGAASWNALDFPNRTDLFNEFFPADFICEGADQIRGWFNLLMVSSIAAFNKSPFKAVYMHGMVTDIGGVKMSKSLGNIISPNEITQKYGADTLRYYFSKANPGEDFNFSWDEVKLHYRNLSILYNTAYYLVDAVEQSGIDPRTLSVKAKSVTTQQLSVEELYILSKVASATKKIQAAYEAYDIFAIAEQFETAMFDVSRSYIQLIRDKMASGTPAEQAAVAHTLYDSIFKILVMAHPVVPFITEQLYQVLKKNLGTADCVHDSISLVSWDVIAPNERLINEKLEASFATADTIMQAILSAREKANVGVRWPLQTATVLTKDDATISAVHMLGDLIKNQTNVKELVTTATFEHVQYTIKPKYAQLKELGKDTATVGQILNGMSGPDAKSMVDSFAQNKPYTLAVAKTVFTIKPEYVEISKSVGEGFTSSDIPKGNVFLTIKITAELEQEGLAREFMRRVQSLRKDAGLEKKDRISLQYNVSDKLQDAITAFSTAITDRCGITDIESVDEITFSHTASDKIKSEQFQIGIEKQVK